MIEKIKNLLRPTVHRIREKKVRHAATKADTHYHQLIKDIKQSGRQKLRFAAYVIFDSTFGLDGVIKQMLNDPEHWDPKIVIIPDVSRGYDHQLKTYTDTKKFFVERYGKEYVLDGWDPQSNEYFDHLEQFNIVYFANPYDSMAHKYHKIVYASKRKVLPIYVSYGYDVGRYTTLSRLKGLELNLIWKLFADTTYTYQDYVDYQVIKGKNVILAGYSKMDNLIQFPVTTNTRKKILISPHHTVSMKDLPLSNFLTYSNLISRLPDMFPDIDFVFRPHPLLFTTLVNNGTWTSEDVDHYLKDLESKGVSYSSGGNYFSVFAESDAIINDCGSFTVEWLYTGKPGCFVYNPNLRDDQLTTLMQKAVSSYTIARSEDDIIQFIKGVSERTTSESYQVEDWVKENIALNYPNVSDFILHELNIFENGD